MSIANNIKGQLQKFTSETGISLAELEIAEQWKEMQQFQKVVSDEITRLRSEMPDLKRQNELFEERAKLTQLKTEYAKRKNSLESVAKEFRKFIKSNGDEESLNKTKADLEKQVFEKKMSPEDIIKEKKYIAEEYLSSDYDEEIKKINEMEYNKAEVDIPPGETSIMVNLSYYKDFENPEEIKEHLRTLIKIFKK